MPLSIKLQFKYSREIKKYTWDFNSGVARVLAESYTPSLASLCVGAFLIIMSRLAAAQTAPDFNIPRITNPPTIDGVVEAKEWTEATRIPVNIEVEPGDHREAQVFAEALLLENGEAV